jgi:hypothetical protein
MVGVAGGVAAGMRCAVVEPSVGAGPGRTLRDDSPMTICPLVAVKIGIRLISACGRPTSSQGIQTL